MSIQDHTFIILAGGLRRSPLNAGLAMPALCVPLGDRTLLEMWLERIAETAAAASVRVVVSEATDREAVARLIELVEHRFDFALHVQVERARWRGTGGVVRDLGAEFGNDFVLVEGATLPPESIRPVLAAMAEGRAVVGVDGSLVPAGVFGIPRGSLQKIPEVGFFDVKEQLLPMLYRDGRPARVARITPETHRLWDLASYLDAIRTFVDEAGYRADSARIDPSARIAGTCFIGCNVVVEAGAIVRDSVLTDGVVVEADAIVARSVLGPGARTAAAETIVDEMRSSIDLTAEMRPRTRRLLDQGVLAG